MFSLKWIGGGDAKLAAATALWMGWETIVDYGVAASVCGGLLTLGLLTARARPLPTVVARLPGFGRLHNPVFGVPYGIALAAAGLLEYPHTSLWAKIVSDLGHPAIYRFGSWVLMIEYTIRQTNGFSSTAY